MIKNILNKTVFMGLIASFPLSSIYANIDLQKAAEETIAQKTGVDVKIVKIEPLDIKKLNLAILEINSNQVPVFISGDGKTIIGMSDIFITSQNQITQTATKIVSQAQSYNTRGRQQKILDSFKGKENLIVSLKSTGKKTNKTTYIVTDPNCPYCKDEMGKIDEVLKDSNVKLILVGIIGHQNSEIKSADILSFNQKLVKANLPKKEKENKLLDHIKSVYFDANYEPIKVDIAPAKEISDIIIRSGVNAVPYKFVIEE